MKSLSRLEQLEVMALHQPNSIEINQALAEECTKEERWEEAIEAYQTVIALYPANAALNVNRIRLGAISLGISSLLFLISEIVRQSVFFDAIGFIDYMSMSPVLATSNILFLPILILLSCAAISIYKLLSTSNDNRLAFWAMVSIIIGTGLFLPFFVIQAIFLPAATQQYIAGNTSALNVYDTALRQPLASVFTVGGYLLLIGLTIFNIAVWGSSYLPKWASTLLWIGWSLFIITEGLPFNYAAEVLRISNPMIHAILVAIGGIGLARGVWQQAPLQLTPTTDSSQKADS